MYQIYVLLAAVMQESVLGLSVSGYNSEEKSESGYSKSSSSSSSSHGSKKYSYHTRVVHRGPYHSYSYSDLDLPLGYGYIYASDFDLFDLDLDPDLDPDLNSVNFFYDPDIDLDLDFSDIELDIDLAKLKYGLYGLNHYSVRSPHFNDYKFRHRLRYRRRPYFRSSHRYFPQYWKPDLDFWGLDNYSLGFGYDKYWFDTDLDLPTSYVHVSSFL